VDATLSDTLAAEAAGILGWAVRGCLDWQAQGLAAPSVVLQATQQYEQDSDVLAEFLAGACEVELDAEVSAADLFAHYQRWTEAQGMTERERLSRTAFGRKLSERFGSRRTMTGKVYQGLARRAL
jgi:putative DNA primase/helicase